MSAIQNAKVSSVSLGKAERGMLTAWVSLDLGSGGVSMGGYHLGGPFCSCFVESVLDTLGVEQWEDLPGTACRIRSTGKGGPGSQVEAIGHLFEDKWFDPSQMDPPTIQDKT